MTWQVPPGWYPDPSGARAWRWWDGRCWTVYRVADPPAPVAPFDRRRRTRFSTPELLAIVVYVFIFGNLALGFSIDGRWRAVAGVGIMAAGVAVVAVLAAYAARSARRSRQDRERRRRHEAALAARADREHSALMRGDLEAGVFGVFQPPRLEPDGVPDADQMRAQAWQPELGDSPPAVRPKNPAPWHVVTQSPTNRFRSP
ncbi:DUF2510 domain-containing protein [Mycobacterium sp. 23]|uniref:DUF2510 domain-containing protein n=1 Tax=Mycobacterium sp. 23 TaxID=3400424 RepID=UPI003AAA9DB5